MPAMRQFLLYPLINAKDNADKCQELAPIANKESIRAHSSGAQAVAIPHNNKLNHSAQPTKNKKKQVEIDKNAEMVVYETSYPSGTSQNRHDDLIAAIKNPLTVPIKTGDAKNSNSTHRFQEFLGTYHHLSAKELADINTQLLRCTHQILHDHFPNLAEEKRLYAFIFFKALLAKNTSANPRTFEATTHNITKKFAKLMKNNKFQTLFSELSLYIDSLLGLRDATPISYFEQLFIAAFLTNAAKLEQSSPARWRANLQEKIELNHYFEQKTDAINDAIEQSCAQHGMTQLLFENYLLENLYHFSIFATSEPDIANEIKNIFNIFVAQLQPVWAVLPESIPLWRRAHFLHTHGNQLFISTDAEITHLFMAHNAKLNSNPSIHTEFFSRKIRSNTAPLYLGPAGCKNIKELKHDLKQNQYKKYLELASFTLGLLMCALAALSQHQRLIHLSNVEKNATMVLFIGAGTLITSLTAFYDRAIRAHNEAAIKKTLSVFSKAPGAQLYQPTHHTSEQSNDIEAQANPLKHENNINSPYLR